MGPALPPLVALDPATDDPAAVTERILATQAPVVRLAYPGLTAYAITGQPELRAALKDDARFQRGYRHWGAWQRGEIDPSSPMARALITDNMITANGPDHLRLRRPVARAFSPTKVQALRPRITRITEELLDALQTAGAQGGPVDLMAAYASPLPIAVIGEILGIPEPDRAPLAPLVARVFTGADLRANTELWAFMAELLAARRAAPGEDVFSALIHAHHDQDRLSDTELVHTAALLAIAGFDTTRVAIANTTAALLTRPQIRARLRSGELGWQAVIEEGLRHRAPAWMLPVAYPIEDVHLAGYTLPAGEPVYLGFGPAGRDPRTHAEAEDFDPDRDQGREGHLAFGAGPHFCLGAHLARLELHTALPLLFDRLPHLALAEPAPPPTPSAMLQAPAHLPVTTLPAPVPPQGAPASAGHDPLTAPGP